MPSVHLDIVGDDTLGGRVQRLCRALDLDAYVSFHGFQPTDVLASFYARAHLHVVSSRHEAAGVVCLEAACAGAPTVGTSVGYVADWAEDRAVAVPVGDSEALAAAIVALLADRDRRVRLAEAARSWALEHSADWTAAVARSLRHRVPRSTSNRFRRWSNARFSTAMPDASMKAFRRSLTGSRYGVTTVTRRARGLGMAGFPESAERSARRDGAERGNVGDHGENAAGARFEERIAAAFLMAAEHEQIRGAVERRQPLVRHWPDETHAIAQRRRLQACANERQQFIAVVDHRERRRR
jgi:hypothetical protein